LNGKKTDVDNCVTNVDNFATNATSRFKAFWACLSVAAITHQKTETDVQLLPEVRCAAPNTTKNRGTMLQKAFRDPTLLIKPYLKKVYSFCLMVEASDHLRGLLEKYPTVFFYANT
jgi:hypothetical protein